MKILVDFLKWLFPEVEESKKSLKKDEHFTGVIEDQRAESQKQCDYLHEERVPKKTQDPFGNKRIEVSPYYHENQFSTSSCVPHAVILALAIERANDGDSYNRLSQLFVYRQRNNYPGAGAWLQDIFNIARKYGAPLFSTLPTPLMATEYQANALNLTNQQYIEAEVYRGDEYYTLENPKDFEEIARIAQLGHGVAILIYANWAEWAVKIPFVEGFLDSVGAPIRHCVCVLPYSGHTDKGMRYVTVQDSAWFGGHKLRHLSEKFITTRCYGAAYWDTVKFLGKGKRPKHTFTKVLEYGANGEEVRQVQKLLIAEGLLPSDLATGYFGGRTLAGIRAFQNKYAADILAPIGLNEPTRTWGSMCIAKANELVKAT